MLKFYFAETEDYNVVLATDGEKAIVLNPSTYYSSVQDAKNEDYSGIVDCESIEEIACETSGQVIEFREDEFDSLEEFSIREYFIKENKMIDNKYKCVSTGKVYHIDQLIRLFRFKEVNGYDGTFEDWIEYEMQKGYLVIMK